MITQHHVHVNRSGAFRSSGWCGWHVHERERRHRRDRHGQPHAAGGVWRHLIGLDKAFGELDKASSPPSLLIAAGFTALLSLFNIGGRFVWASASDRLGRKTTYAVFFILGGLLYFSIPASAAAAASSCSWARSASS